MSEEIDKRRNIALWIILGIALGGGFYWVMDFMEGSESVDVDCLIDTMMYLDLDNTSIKYGKGVIDDGWTIKQVRDLYIQKDYKAKPYLKGFLNIFLKRCEK